MMDFLKEFRIIVRNTEGKWTFLTVKGRDTISKVLKTIVEEGHHPSQSYPVDLYYQGKYLPRDKDVLECGIGENAEIYMAYQKFALGSPKRSTGEYTVVVRPQYGRDFTLRPPPHSNVVQLKKMIQAFEGLLPEWQEVSYEGKILDDKTVLDEGTVPSGSTLQLKSLVADGKRIFIDFCSERLLLHVVQTTMTAGELLVELQNREGVYLFKPRLFVGDSRLKGDEKLSDHNIRNNMIIKVQGKVIDNVREYIQSLWTDAKQKERELEKSHNSCLDTENEISVLRALHDTSCNVHDDGSDSTCETGYESLVEQIVQEKALNRTLSSDLQLEHERVANLMTCLEHEREKQRSHVCLREKCPDRTQEAEALHEKLRNEQDKVAGLEEKLREIQEEASEKVMTAQALAKTLRTEKSRTDDHISKVMRENSQLKEDNGHLEQGLEAIKRLREQEKQEKEQEIRTLSSRLTEESKKVEKLEENQDLLESILAKHVVCTEKLESNLANLREKHLKAEASHQRNLAAARKENEERAQRLNEALLEEMKHNEELRMQMVKLNQTQTDMADVQKDMRSRLNDVACQQTELLDCSHQMATSTSTPELRDSFLSRLPTSVKNIIDQIQDLIGGDFRQFGRELLGVHFDWIKFECDAGSRTCFGDLRTFWRLIEEWVRLAENPTPGVSVDEETLSRACSALRVDPRKKGQVSQEERSQLDEKFSFMIKNVCLSLLMISLRDTGLLSDDARNYMILPERSVVKLERLLNVVYSFGQEGYQAFISALTKSGHQHVVNELQGNGTAQGAEQCPSEQPELPERIRGAEGTSPKDLAEESPSSALETLQASTNQDSRDEDVRAELAQMKRNIAYLTRIVEQGFVQTAIGIADVKSKLNS